MAHRTTDRRAVGSRTLNSSVEFDSPFYSHGDGTISSALGVYAPCVWEDGNKLYSDQGDWSAVNGYSGQYGYGGPVMHPSEFLGGRMAEYVLENKGTYVITEVLDMDSEDGNEEPYGWALLKYSPPVVYSD